MTREEIRGRARDLNYNLRAGGRDNQGDIYHIERELEMVARATLEEAARAVCPDCGVGVRLLPQTAEWEYGHPDDDDYRYDCAACAIHDLIAALDKEASHE